MRTTLMLRLAAIALLLGFAAWTTPAQDQSSDDVAAAARKAREQQKAEPKPKKVITNDDMPAPPSASPAQSAKSEGGPASKTDAQSAQGDDKKEEDDPNSEAYWHKRFQKIRDKIDVAEKELDVLQRELDKDQVQYYPDPQKALMQQHDRSDINNKAAKIDAKKKEIEGLNQQLSDLEDELRKSGGDPGWGR
jgi:parvulin-like peptidyl-prolyl isomerase